MSEIKDPLQAIQEVLNEPIEAIQPTEFDNEAIAQFLAARYSNPTLQTELAKGELNNEPEPN